MLLHDRLWCIDFHCISLQTQIQRHIVGQVPGTLNTYSLKSASVGPPLSGAASRGSRHHEIIFTTTTAWINRQIMACIDTIFTVNCFTY